MERCVRNTQHIVFGTLIDGWRTLTSIYSNTVVPVCHVPILYCTSSTFLYYKLMFLSYVDIDQHGRANSSMGTGLSWFLVNSHIHLPPSRGQNPLGTGAFVHTFLSLWCETLHAFKCEMTFRTKLFAEVKKTTMIIEFHTPAPSPWHLVAADWRDVHNLLFSHRLGRCAWFV